MACPHCGETLRLGTPRCPVCFGKIAYRKAAIRSRILRVLVLALFFAGLYLSDATGQADAARIVLNLIVFTACAVGLWNHRSPEAEDRKAGPDSD